jgi:hypothetical protein
MENNKYLQNLGGATLLKQQPLRNSKRCEENIKKSGEMNA